MDQVGYPKFVLACNGLKKKIFRQFGVSGHVAIFLKYIIKYSKRKLDFVKKPKI